MKHQPSYIVVTTSMGVGHAHAVDAIGIRATKWAVVLCVDSGNLLCWTSGVLSIAFTNCRQRLGELVADTIVIRVPRVSTQGNATN